jgi:hypothetical protein
MADVQGTVLVRGKRVKAEKDENGVVWRDVMCPHRRRMKITQCGPAVAATFEPNEVS